MPSITSQSLQTTCLAASFNFFIYQPSLATSITCKLSLAKMSNSKIVVPNPKKRKLTSTPIHVKAEILRRHLFHNEKINELAVKYDVKANTITTWKKHADTIFKEAGSLQPARKRMRASKYEDVEIALLYWLKDMRSKNGAAPLSKDFMIAKAEW